MMFQAIGAKAPPISPTARTAGSTAAQARALISRYPSLSETELALLINLYRELSALDMAMMISDDEIAAKLDRFSAEQRSSIRTPFRQYAALVGTGVLGIFAIAWALAFA